jgi:glycosyltransferase involved in cell wall biosynthesis
MRVAIANAEPIYAYQREEIGAAFQCPVRETYGMAEMVAAASECAEGSLHGWPDVGVAEVLHDEADEPVGPGESGRLVATGLVNRAMPLIRYGVGDRARFAPDSRRCACGRGLPILEQIEGRSDDVVITPDGRRVGRFDPVFKADFPIREAQIVQEAPDRLVVRVVPAPGYLPEHAEDLRHRVRMRVGDSVAVTVESVDRIPRTRAGKFRAVVRRFRTRSASRARRCAWLSPPCVRFLRQRRDAGAQRGGLHRAGPGGRLRAGHPQDRLEVLVADGLSTDGTREIVAAAAKTRPGLRLLDSPGRTAPCGLNVGVREARGTIVVRVDGHCEIERDYVSRCVAHLEAGDGDAVGGSVVTVGEDRLADTIAVAMSSPFGVGGSAFRTVRGRTLLVDTVPFPAYTRAILDRVGPFDEELVRNQDDEYNARLRKLGGRVLLAADVRSRYYSRGSWRGLWRQYFQYGYWKVRVLQKHPRQMKLRHFVPAAFVGTLALSAAFAPFWRPLAALGLLAAYALAVLARLSSLRASAHGARIFRLALAFGILHVAYGAGFWAGS